MTCKFMTLSQVLFHLLIECGETSSREWFPQNDILFSQSSCGSLG